MPLAATIPLVDCMLDAAQVAISLGRTGQPFHFRATLWALTPPGAQAIPGLAQLTPEVMITAYVNGAVTMLAGGRFAMPA